MIVIVGVPSHCLAEYLRQLQIEYLTGQIGDYRVITKTCELKKVPDCPVDLVIPCVGVDQYGVVGNTIVLAELFISLDVKSLRYLPFENRDCIKKLCSEYQVPVIFEN